MELPREKVFQFLSDSERSAVDLIPNLKSFEQVGTDKYNWTFEPLKIAGLTLHIKFDADHWRTAPDKAGWKAIKKSGSAELSGEFTLKSKGTATEIHLKQELTTYLNIPFLAKVVANSIQAKYLSGQADAYLDNLVEAIKKHYQ